MYAVYSIEYTKRVISEDIPSLSKIEKGRVLKAIEGKLAIAPFHYGKPLRHSLGGHRALRIGDYRIIYRIEGHIVIIVTVQHRKSVYKT